MKVDIPALEFGLDSNQPARLEVQSDEDHNVWLKATLDGVSPEGKVFLRYDAEPRTRRHVDLTQLAYRWLYGEELASAQAVQGPDGPRAVAASVLRAPSR